MIKPIDSRFRAMVNQMVQKEWTGPLIVTKGTVHDTSRCDGFVYLLDGALAGYVLYTVANAQCEILVLQSMKENQGIGAALLKAVIDTAKACQCTRVWLITTNDNIRAIRYYQRFGFTLEAVHINALDRSRQLKPAIPLLGNEGIPLQHEFEFVYAL